MVPAGLPRIQNKHIVTAQSRENFSCDKRTNSRCIVPVTSKMSSDDNLHQCFDTLKSISKGKIARYDDALNILQAEAEQNGLDTQELEFLIRYIVKTDLRATYLVPIIKCLIPKHRMDGDSVETVIVHWLATFNSLPVTVSITIIQWLIGLWEYQLVDRQSINIYYDGYFYSMLKKERLEPHLARLIYLLTKPEDVTRRQVNRLLHLQMKYSKPRKPINALLSLFKSYKPELVPEKIPSMNVESVWKPIPEALRLRFEDARERCNINENRTHEHFDWNVARSGTKTTVQPLLPSVRYFHIGSSIYRDKDSKSIFDLANFDDVGKFHFSVEMPCNATSLLANAAGYHFLTFADFEYQSRFSYNLYNTLRRAFLLERGKFSNDQMEQLLDMTIEFSRYMQEGIPVVNSFLYDYFVTMSDDYRSKFLQLSEWCTSIPVADLESFIFGWIRDIFVLSSLEEKCEIIGSLRKLAVNLFVKHGFGNEPKKPSAFLGQVPASDLIDVIPVLAILAEDLVTTGLTVHDHNILFMHAALNFYEEMCRLECRSTVASWTIAPPAVIYGGLISKSCAILSRVCSLLLRYREMYLRMTELDMRNNYDKQPGFLNTYGSDFARVLWNNDLFGSRDEGMFLKDVPLKYVQFLPGDEKYKDALFNIDKHPAVLPYKYFLSQSGLDIRTQEDTLEVAKSYFPAVSQLIQQIDNF